MSPVVSKFKNCSRIEPLLLVYILPKPVVASIFLQRIEHVERLEVYPDHMRNYNTLPYIPSKSHLFVEIGTYKIFSAALKVIDSSYRVFS